MIQYELTLLALLQKSLNGDEHRDTGSKNVTVEGIAGEAEDSFSYGEVFELS